MKLYSYIKRLCHEYYSIIFFSWSLFLLKQNFISERLVVVRIDWNGMLLSIGFAFFLFVSLDLESLSAADGYFPVMSSRRQLAFSSRLFIFEDNFSSFSFFNFSQSL